MSYADVILADSPRGYWRLDEISGTDAADASGYGHHGVFVNSPSIGQASPLGRGAGFSFNSVTSTSANMTAEVSSWGGTATAISIEFWINTLSAATSIVMVAYSATPPDAGNREVIINANAVSDYLSVSSGGYGKTLPVDVADGVWHHVVVILRRTAPYLRAYVDGVKYDIDVSSGLWGPWEIASLTVGGFDAGDAGGTVNDASFDEVAIYRAELSEARVLAHYEAGLSESASLNYDFTEPWGLGVPAGTFGPYTGKPHAVHSADLDLTEPWGLGVPAGTFGPYTGKPRVRDAELDLTEPWGVGVPAGTFGPYDGKPQAVRSDALDLTEPWGVGVPAGTFGPYTGRAVFERDADLDFTEPWGVGVPAGTFGPYTGRTIARDVDLDLTEPWGIGIAAGVFGAFTGKPHAVRSADLDLTEPWGIGIAAGVFGPYTAKPETKHQYRIYRRVSPTAAWTLYAIVAPDDPGVTPTAVTHVVTGAPGESYWYQVRAVNVRGRIDEEPLRQKLVAFDEDGSLILPVPNRPSGLRIVRAAGGQLTAYWSYTPGGQAIAPARFRVYRAIGDAAFDFSMPFATVAYRSLVQFSISLGQHAHGTRVRVIVRAESAAGALEQNQVTAEAVASATAPAAVQQMLVEVV